MKTDFAKEILAIAHRVLDEQKAGRQVDPLRLDWARSIISFNTCFASTTPGSVDQVSEPQT